MPVLISIHVKSSLHTARLIILCVLLTLGLSAFADQHRPTFPVQLSNAEIEIHHYPADGEMLALWIASGSGLQPRHAALAAQLSHYEVESWQVDLIESLFLPRGTNSIRNLNPALLVELIEQAHAQTGKTIVLIGNSYAAIPVLRSMRQWQTRHQGDYLKGAILFSPNAYASIPALGMEPDYIPETGATNLPVMIFQSARHGNRWQLDRLVVLRGRQRRSDTATPANNPATPVTDYPFIT